MRLRLSIVKIVALVGMSLAQLMPQSAAAAVSLRETSPGAVESAPVILDEPANVRHIGAPAGPAPRPQVKENPKTGNPLWAIPLARLSATRDRPIFSPSRRPPPAVVAPVASAPPKAAVMIHAPEPPKLSLVGTIVSKAAAIGIFVDNATRKAILLKEGQSHDGWTLQSVERGAATLKRFEQSVVIAMRTHDNPDGPLSGAGSPPQMPRSSSSAASAASAPASDPPTTGGGQQAFGQSPFAATAISERATPFGATPLFERTNR